MIKTVRFTEAFEALLKGKKISRDNEFWGSKGLFLELDIMKEDMDDKIIRLCNEGGTRSFYTPLQSDILADDWYIV